MAKLSLTPSVAGSSGTGTTVVLVLVMFILWLSVTGVLQKIKQQLLADPAQNASEQLNESGTSPMPVTIPNTIGGGSLSPTYPLPHIQGMPLPGFGSPGWPGAIGP